jgi:hypothetical protein
LNHSLHPLACTLNLLPADRALMPVPSAMETAMMRSSGGRYGPIPPRRLRFRAKLAAAALLALSAGCGSGSGGGSGGSGGGPGANDPGNGGGSGGGSTLEPTFASIQEHVFTPICTACHAGAAAPLGLRLDEDNSYGLLVGVPSAQQPQIARVAPGNPSASYLIQKLEGTAAVGERMPLGGSPLPQADIAMIRQWIVDGALPPQGSAPTAPIRVTSLAPLPDQVLEAMPASIIALFDRELDATSVTADTFTLVRSGGDGTFDDGNEVPIAASSVGVPADNPLSAVLDLTGADGVADTYRVRLAGGGPTAILDLDNNALDGEFSGEFPSGDGTAGGDFVADFIVDAADDGTLQPTLDSIQTHVFTPICSACHTGPASEALPAGMDLTDADSSFAQLVGVASVQAPALSRVEPGEPDESYLVHKLEGTADQGLRMPLGLPPLDATEIDAIREWIALGAER